MGLPMNPQYARRILLALVVILLVNFVIELTVMGPQVQGRPVSDPTMMATLIVLGFHVIGIVVAIDTMVRFSGPESGED